MSRTNAPNVTAEVMKKAWFMHNKKLSTADIASLLSMSKNTVCRIIEIMETANKGDITALNALYNGGYVKMKKYACEFFNIAQGGADESTDDPNLAACLVNILQTLTNIENSLALLLASLGVEGGAT